MPRKEFDYSTNQLEVVENVPLAVQCCKDVGTGSVCERYDSELGNNNDGCFVGIAASLTATTYEQAAAICSGRGGGSRLCTAEEILSPAIPCTGCNYNSLGVWSGTPCPAISPFGATVMDGGNGNHPDTCVLDASTTSIVPGSQPLGHLGTIAMQCCSPAATRTQEAIDGASCKRGGNQATPNVMTSTCYGTRSFYDPYPTLTEPD